MRRCAANLAIVFTVHASTVLSSFMILVCCSACYILYVFNSSCVVGLTEAFASSNIVELSFLFVCCSYSFLVRDTSPSSRHGRRAKAAAGGSCVLRVWEGFFFIF